MSGMFRKPRSARIPSATSSSDVTSQSPRNPTPELGFEPRSEAPQASRITSALFPRSLDNRWTPPWGFEPQSKAPQAFSLSRLTYGGAQAESETRLKSFRAPGRAGRLRAERERHSPSPWLPAGIPRGIVKSGRSFHESAVTGRDFKYRPWKGQRFPEKLDVRSSVVSEAYGVRSRRNPRTTLPLLATPNECS